MMERASNWHFLFASSREGLWVKLRVRTGLTSRERSNVSHRVGGLNLFVRQDSVGRNDGHAVFHVRPLCQS
jgi:hypothetical protein